MSKRLPSSGNIWSARSAGQAFSPLDEELALVAGQLTPLLAESLVRLGAWLPFAHAATMLAFFTHTTVSASSARRTTQAVGAAGETLCEQAATATHSCAASCDEARAERLCVGVDGAMVPLLKGEWGEVKTVTVGEVGKPVWEENEWVVHSEQLSYLSRLCDVDDLIALAPLELARRQVEQSAHVCGVSDGALWIQRFFDSCCPAAVRILDFAHAAHYLAQAGAAFFGVQTPQLVGWLATQCTELKHGDPLTVVAELLHLSLLAHEQAAPHTVQSAIADAHDYLKARLPMIQYALFRTHGDPIGSGASESANKLVVERRLKGAGMHWQRTNVNPMLVLTNTAANERWDELWPAASQHQRDTRRQRLLERHAPPPPPPLPPAPPPQKTTWRPAKDHPWRRQSIGRQHTRLAA